MSCRPGIPWRVALQQCLPPLSRLFQSLASCRSKVYNLSANGYCLTLPLSQPRGACHSPARGRGTLRTGSALRGSTAARSPRPRQGPPTRSVRRPTGAAIEVSAARALLLLRSKPTAAPPPNKGPRCFARSCNSRTVRQPRSGLTKVRTRRPCQQVQGLSGEISSPWRCPPCRRLPALQGQPSKRSSGCRRSTRRNRPAARRRGFLAPRRPLSGTTTGGRPPPRQSIRRSGRPPYAPAKSGIPPA